MTRRSTIPEGMSLATEEETPVIEGPGDLIVHGRVTGSVRIDGTLVIEPSGSVRGPVAARSVTVRGVLVGNAIAEEVVQVEDQGRVVGDLAAPRVRIVGGARCRGRVRMSGEGAAPQPSERPPGRPERVEDAHPLAAEPSHAPPPRAEAEEATPEPERPSRRAGPAPAPVMPRLGRRRGQRIGRAS
jgi:cytoskeletal protein CcmA (bactofilin family)